MQGCRNGSNRATDAALAALIMFLGVLLVLSGLVMLEHWRMSSARRQSLHLEDVLGGVSAAIGTLMVMWWLASALLAVASAGLYSGGHARAAAAVGKASPAFMRRLAFAALGLQLAAGTAAAHADVSPFAPVGISAEWAPAAQQAAGARNLGLAQSTGTPGSLKGTDQVQPQWKPTPPLSNPRLVTAPPLRAEPRGVPPETAAEVTVLAGDSLWSIAAHALGPEASDVDIALEWPRWFEANRTAIGDNPDMLLPGQILHPPSAI